MAMHISKADAIDVRKYRRAKAAAEAAGEDLVIDQPEPERPKPPAEGSIIVPYGAPPRQYLALKAQAISEQKPLVFVDSDGNEKSRHEFY